jgi:hypothetical protein
MCLSRFSSHYYNSDLGLHCYNNDIDTIADLMPLLNVLFPSLSCWLHLAWCGVNNTSGMLAYSKQYAFPNLFHSPSRLDRPYGTPYLLPKCSVLILVDNAAGAWGLWPLSSSSAEVETAWSYTSTRPCVFMTLCLIYILESNGNCM